jgi:hypothetical protein
MTIELGTMIKETETKFPFQLAWRNQAEPPKKVEESVVIPPEGTRVWEISLSGETIPLILPDTNAVGYDEGNFIEDKRASRFSRKIFELNNETIGISESYEGDLKKRREIISLVRENVSDIPQGFLKSMGRSFAARTYHREKRIKQAENNVPLKIIKKISKNVFFVGEADNYVRERKSKDTAAVFDKFLGRLFKKYLRKFDESIKLKMGGVDILKDGYEYYLAGAMKDFYETFGIERTVELGTLENIARASLIQKQEDIRKAKIQQVASIKEISSAEIEKINNEPTLSLEESIKLYIAGQILYSRY